jgi:two-component system, OmpR family, response regulator ChvI
LHDRQAKLNYLALDTILSASYGTVIVSLILHQRENKIIPSKDDVVSSIRQAARDASAASKSRILLVDDEADIIAIYKNGLKRSGFEVEAYDDPEKALLRFKPDAYDLAILDIRMPKMSGFELCRELRKTDEKVKICLMTAFEMHLREFEKVLPSIKVDGLITKPVRISDLGSIVQRVLDTSGTQRKENGG